MIIIFNNRRSHLSSFDDNNSPTTDFVSNNKQSNIINNKCTVCLQLNKITKVETI